MLVAGKTFSDFATIENTSEATQKVLSAVEHSGYFSLERMFQTLGVYLGGEEGKEICTEDQFHDLWLDDTNYSSSEALERLIEIDYFTLK